MKLKQSLLLALCALCAVTTFAAPKRVLVVSTTTGFRHSSIPTAEKIIGELAKSSGAFTVDYAGVENGAAEFKGADGKQDKEKVTAAITKVLAEKMSRSALANYDAVIFANTLATCLCLTGKLCWISSSLAKDSSGCILRRILSLVFQAIPR